MTREEMEKELIRLRNNLWIANMSRTRQQGSSTLIESIKNKIASLETRLNPLPTVPANTKEYVPPPPSLPSAIEKIKRMFGHE